MWLQHQRPSTFLLVDDPLLGGGLDPRLSEASIPVTPRLPPVITATRSSKYSWEVEAPDNQLGPQAKHNSAMVSTKQGLAGLGFDPCSHGSLREVCRAISAHTITLESHRLSHVNNRPLDSFLPVEDSTCPNQRLSSALASLPTPSALPLRDANPREPRIQKRCESSWTAGPDGEINLPP